MPHIATCQRNLPLIQSRFNGIVFSPAMVRREKCRRPKALTVDVKGSQVGVNGSPFTVCFLCIHKDRAKVLQLQRAVDS